MKCVRVLSVYERAKDILKKLHNCLKGYNTKYR
jgi:hypothetical protein